MKLYMLDTNICLFIMREHPESVLRRLQEHSVQKHKIAVSVITYAEMRFGAIGNKASPKHSLLVDEFVKRLDVVLPWDKAAVDATTYIKQVLAAAGTPIGSNDAAIAGHALSVGAVLVTNNTREFLRVPELVFEDWVKQ